MLAFDIEIYPNYALFAFADIDVPVPHTFELRGTSATLVGDEREWLLRLLSNNTIFGFNSRKYDLPLMLYALAGATCDELYEASKQIIGGTPHWKLPQVKSRVSSVKRLAIDHFDIQEPTPGVRVGLKLYGMRMNAPLVAELPYEPSTKLTPAQMDKVKAYCANDLHLTAMLYDRISERIDLRKRMGEIYKADLRSKSDAQIAEVVMRNLIGGDVVGDVDKTYRYNPPTYLHFTSPKLNAILKKFASETYTLDGRGAIMPPKWLIAARIKIGDVEYQLGIGGLHSCEKRQAITPQADEMLIEQDVASYYPSIIVNGGLSPKRLSSGFIEAYSAIVNRRLAAKRRGDVGESESLKIVINGGFGKFGSPHSLLYAPDLFLAVTITGQLTLLMLIERAVNAGVRVISANTDGVVLLVPNSLKRAYSAIHGEWERLTDLTLETDELRGLYSRDVNNYIAVKTDGTVKGKGIFTSPSLMHNPYGQVCASAVKEYLLNGTPLSTTIRECDEIADFVFVRTANGGAKFGNERIGKILRWIYTTDGGVITYEKNGNRVPKAEGCLPVMRLPAEMPANIDYARYVADAEALLDATGATTRQADLLAEPIDDNLDFLQ